MSQSNNPSRVFIAEAFEGYYLNTDLIDVRIPNRVYEGFPGDGYDEALLGQEAQAFYKQGDVFISAIENVSSPTEMIADVDTDRSEGWLVNEVRSCYSGKLAVDQVIELPAGHVFNFGKLVAAIEDATGTGGLTIFAEQDPRRAPRIEELF